MNKKFVILTTLLIFAAHEIIGASGRVVHPLATVKKNKFLAPKKKELSIEDKTVMEALGQGFKQAMREVMVEELAKSMPELKTAYKQTYDEAGNIRVEALLEGFRDCVKKVASWQEGLKKCSQDFTGKETVDAIGITFAMGPLTKGYLAIAEEKGDKVAAEKMVDDQMSEKVAQDLIVEANKYAPQVLELMNKAIAIVKAEGPSAVKPAIAEVVPASAQ